LCGWKSVRLRVLGGGHLLQHEPACWPSIAGTSEMRRLDTGLKKARQEGKRAGEPIGLGDNHRSAMKAGNRQGASNSGRSARRPLSTSAD